MEFELRLKNADEIDTCSIINCIEDTIVLTLSLIVSIIAALFITKWIFIVSAIILFEIVNKAWNIGVHIKRKRIRRKYFGEYDYGSITDACTNQIDIMSMSAKF